MEIHCIESTFEINCPEQNLRVRLWINEDEIDNPIALHSQTFIVNTVKEIIATDKTIPQKIELICKEIENINAIQIHELSVDNKQTKTGMVVYTVGFDNDVHG